MKKETFEERVEVIVREAGSIAALSRASGISPRSISGYINGTSDPSRTKLVALTDAANVSMEWLAAGRGQMHPGDKSTTGTQVNHLEDPLIKEIKIWLREMTKDNPGWRAWFEIELLRKIPEFKEYREKNKPRDIDQNSATG